MGKKRTSWKPNSDMQRSINMRTFREALKKANAIDTLFRRFEETLRSRHGRADHRRHHRCRAHVFAHQKGLMGLPARDKRKTYSSRVYSSSMLT
jgi:hypothetical protein